MTRKWTQSAYLVRLLIVFFVLYILGHVLVTIRHSLFFKKPDRVNMVFYSKKPTFISLGTTDNINYIGFFDPELKVRVPGGYGRYKIGAVGRLSEIEKKPVLMQKTFSSVVSAYVDYYFYPKESEIYFEGFNFDSKFSTPHLGFVSVFWPSSIRTNASFLNRLYIYLALLNKKRSDFALISSSRFASSQEGEEYFREDRFDRTYKGFFYESGLRDEGKHVQVIYSTYRSALTLSRIIEGEGVRISDLSTSKSDNSECFIREQKAQFSKSSAYLISLFGCTFEKKEALAPSEIELELGTKLESNWE